MYKKLEQLIKEGFVKFYSKYHINFYEKGRQIIIYNTETENILIEYHVGIIDKTNQKH